jgi:hypothetical protein
VFLSSGWTQHRRSRPAGTFHYSGKLAAILCVYPDTPP